MQAQLTTEEELVAFHAAIFVTRSCFNTSPSDNTYWAGSSVLSDTLNFLIFGTDDDFKLDPIILHHAFANKYYRKYW